MVRVDLHVHSHYSNDGGWSSLQELVDRARESQLDRILLTDHNTVEGARALARLAPQLTIVGEEINTLVGEVIGLFIFDMRGMS
jgi:predicted metal-dependent phosphoesterase TrpH